MHPKILFPLISKKNAITKIGPQNLNDSIVFLKKKIMAKNVENTHLVY